MDTSAAQSLILNMSSMCQETAWNVTGTLISLNQNKEWQNEMLARIKRDIGTLAFTLYIFD